MDYRDSADELEFRHRLRKWLVENDPGLPAASTDDAYWRLAAEWHRSLYQAGFFGMRWPSSVGGFDLPDSYELIVDEELAAAGAPPKPGDGYLIHALLTHGGEELKQRFVPGLISGQQRWCQGFSEPEAGSDLASLRTTAVLDGDEYVIRGHKVWTSHSEDADWCLVLARTDPQAPKHKGISAFVMDMHQPAVQQRPLQLMNGVANEFGQLFIDGARVPVDNLVGAPGDGWAIAMTTLNSERDPRSLGFFARYRKLVLDQVAAMSRQGGHASRRERENLAWAFVQTEMLRVHVQRRMGERHDAALGVGSVDKLLMTWVEQAVGHAACDLARSGSFDGDGTWLSSYLYSRSQSVMGGTSEIQKNLIANRLLGLGGAG
jgi:alkylation response protein AidB-like acyl-CoA dehydrogenase